MLNRVITIYVCIILTIRINILMWLHVCRVALFTLQLIEEENVKAVVSMNEDYELQLFSNNAEVCQHITSIRMNPLVEECHNDMIA